MLLPSTSHTMSGRKDGVGERTVWEKGLRLPHSLLRKGLFYFAVWEASWGAAQAVDSLFPPAGWLGATLSVLAVWGEENAGAMTPDRTNLQHLF